MPQPATLKEILDNRKIKIEKIKIKPRFARQIYEWQDHAARMAKKLGIYKPSKNWFKLFKEAYKKNKKGLLDITYSAISDLPKTDPERYFFKVFWLKANGR